MYIYLDVILLLNLMINGMILCLTGWSLGLRRNRLRMIAAASMSAGYVALGIAVPIPFLYHPIIKFFMSGLLIFLAFGLHSRRQFMQALGTFYLISFLLGGAVLGYSFFMRTAVWTTGTQILTQRMNFVSLAQGLAVGGAAIYFLARPLRRRSMKCSYLYPVEISYNDKKIHITGYMDTGNHLYTIGGQYPVVLIEKEALQVLLSDAVNEYLTRIAPERWIDQMGSCGDDHWQTRIHCIAYRAIGNSSLLLGFRPDEVLIALGGSQRHRFSCVVGIYSAALSEDGSYQALLHSECIQS